MKIPTEPRSGSDLRSGIRCRCRRRDERGIATVWGVAWLVVCLCLGWLGLVVGDAVARQHSVDAAADLAALSAAGSLQRGEDPCRTAQDIAVANDAELTDCGIDGADVLVKVTAPIELPFGMDGELVGRARAGPM